jgi:hypothetical protein
MNEESVKQIELLKTIQQIGSRVEKRHAKVDSTLLIKEDRER